MKKLIMLLLVTLGLVFILSAPKVNAAATVTAANEDVRKELKEGHTFKIEITKENVAIYKDGKDIDKNDPFYLRLVEYAREYWLTSSKVHSLYVDKYVIDIDSDGAVHKTLAPKEAES
ncbi:MAG: hypothetical protein IKS98_06890 [Lachnospiraceae bacterium]|nr:hypothetical protein [Lachnospiraceae bacterium]